MEHWGRRLGPWGLVLGFSLACGGAQRSCENGDADACFVDGYAIYAGMDGVEVDLELAKQKLTRGCELGNAAACSTLPELEALPGELAACEARDAACGPVGRRYLEGRGVRTDHAMGHLLLERAAAAGDPDAWVERVRGYVRGDHPLGRDLAEARRIGAEACDRGHQEACALGKQVQDGMVLPEPLVIEGRRVEPGQFLVPPVVLGRPSDAEVDAIGRELERALATKDPAPWLRLFDPASMKALAFQGVPVIQACVENYVGAFVAEPEAMFQIQANAAAGGTVKYLGVQQLRGGTWARLSIRPPSGAFLQWSVRIAQTSGGLRIVDLHSLANGEVVSASWRQAAKQRCTAVEEDTAHAEIQALYGRISKTYSEGPEEDVARVFLAGSEVARSARINHNLAVVLSLHGEDSPEARTVLSSYIERFPEDRYTPILRCWWAMREERYADASTCWEALARAEGDDPQLLVFAAAQARNAGEGARATRLLDTALASEPELALGRALRAEGI